MWDSPPKMTDNLNYLYLKKDWNLKIFYSIMGKIEDMLDCPCIVQGKCLHDNLPSGEVVGGMFCGDKCPASKIWYDFRHAVEDAKDKYLYGI